jgi:hypothetical protein
MRKPRTSPGGDGARTALSVIAIVDDGELGMRPDELADS